MKMTDDEKYMRAAIREAKKAYALGEVPIGCVIVFEGKIIGRGYNRRIADKNVLSHAEINAIKKACKKMGDWRLEGCTMYITLEPCPMCAGAIIQARIPKVLIGSMNPKAGCAGSVMNLLDEKGFNHQVETEIGILGEECPGIKVPGPVMYLLFNNLDPSFRRFDFTHLDAGQRVVNLLGGRTHLLHSAWEADLFTVIYNLSDR